MKNEIYYKNLIENSLKEKENLLTQIENIRST